MAQLNWDVVARRGGQLALAGPTGTKAQLRGVVKSLRKASVEAPALVAEITGLHTEAARAAQKPVYVVDRARWVEANARSFEVLIGEQLTTEAPGSARLASEEMAATLAVLSSRVLGQYDPYVDSGRLLLVAPNFVKTERALDLDVIDFRRWVNLHELTHAVQFEAAPWLADYTASAIRTLTFALSDTSESGQRLAATIRAFAEVVRGKEDATGLLRAVLDEESAEQFDRITAVMSLLEGHADVVMDEVGPARIPSVRRIRASFEARRKSSSPADLLVRRLLGMEAKLAQYRNGAAFVRTVIGSAGHAGLNAVWAGPDNLPRPSEIAAPELWLARVVG